MKTVQTMIGVCAAIALHCHVYAQTVIYHQTFELGVRPPEFTTWNSGLSFPSMWKYQPAIDGTYSLAIQEGASGFDFATFCQLPQLLNNLTVTFSFRCNAYPDDYGLEIVDLYDAFGDELFDVYLNPSGQLTMTVGGSMGVVSKPVPTNHTVQLQLHYSTSQVPNVATLTWSESNGPLGGEINGAYRTDGQSTFAVAQLLFGPVESPITFIYDDLLVTTP